MTDRGNSAARRDIAYHVHGYTNLKKHQDQGPLIITSGDGIRVQDDSGKTYIEGLAGLWCTSLGFSEERLIEAATGGAERFEGRMIETMHVEQARALIARAEAVGG